MTFSKTYVTQNELEQKEFDSGETIINERQEELPNTPGGIKGKGKGKCSGTYGEYK